ncbi:hypothetical protein C0V76_19280 [Uliginosibacterium sp. TH139]|nr:hypothetical protein C0V76_19280 [Uliginosibacterium sp. TH139]
MGEKTGFSRPTNALLSEGNHLEIITARLDEPPVNQRAALTARTALPTNYHRPSDANDQMPIK